MTKKARHVATLAEKARKVYRLSDFDVYEVSPVDRPANLVEWIVVKGADMTESKLQEILDRGDGTFISRLAASAKNQFPGDAPPLRLTKSFKVATTVGLGAILDGLLTIAKAVDGAEETADGAASLPEDLVELLRQSAVALGQMGGLDLEASDKTPQRGDQIKAQLSETKTVLQGILGRLDKRDASSKTSPTSAPDPIAALTAQIAKQGEMIEKLAGSVALPAAGAHEGDLGRRTEPDEFRWPLDMNEGKQHGRGRPTAYRE